MLVGSVSLYRVISADKYTPSCWCFWTWTVPINTLVSSDVIIVRAMDEAMNIQPRDMYLNATSMLNNWSVFVVCSMSCFFTRVSRWFRVAIRKETSQDGISLTFEHPAPVGEHPIPGWMEVSLK
jgi:nitrate reductase (NAD(P)H)